MRSVTTHEAKTQLSRLLAAVEAGEEIIICRGNTPVARLSGTGTKLRSKRPKVGTVTSLPVAIAPDAFAALADDDLSDWGL